MDNSGDLVGSPLVGQEIGNFITENSDIIDLQLHIMHFHHMIMKLMNGLTITQIVLIYLNLEKDMQ
jgi:hypothetical protein